MHLPFEWLLWIMALLAAAVAFIADRIERHGLSGWSVRLAFAGFFLGALIWMFSDTYHHYFGSKEDSLRVSYWGSYREHEMWKEIVQAFTKRHPDITIKQEYITDQYEAKIQQLLLANDAPDVMLFQDEPLPHFVSSGKFEVLDSWCQTPGLEVQLNDYWATAVQSFKQDNKTYGIPIWGGDCLILYNKDVFKEAAIPEPPEAWTTEEFLDTCQKLTKDLDQDGRVDRYGFLIPGWVYWLPFTYAFGADYLDETRTQWTMWGPKAEAGLQFWQDLRYRYHVSPQRGELTEGDSVAFMTGRVAMFTSGPWSMPPLNEAGVNFDIAPIPRGPDGLATRVTWDALLMFAGSKKKDQAWRFIQFVTSLAGQEIVAKYQRSVPALKAGQAAFVAGNPKVQSQRFIDAFAYARIQPISEAWQLMSREITSEVDLMLDDKQTVHQTVMDLAQNVQLAKHFKMPDMNAIQGGQDPGSDRATVEGTTP